MTDRAERPLELAFRDWLDQELSELPKAIVAVCVNLYDAPFAAELVGATEFDEDDDDWACEEDWRGRQRFELSSIEAQWEERLAVVHEWLTSWFETCAGPASLARRLEALGVGFVDGDLLRVDTEGR